MAMGNWPERQCPICGCMIPTYRRSMAHDNANGAWDAKTETLHHYETGELCLCHHGGGDKKLHGWACSGSGVVVGGALSMRERIIDTRKPTTQP